MKKKTRFFSLTRNCLIGQSSLRPRVKISPVQRVRIPLLKLFTCRVTTRTTLSSEAPLGNSPYPKTRVSAPPSKRTALIRRTTSSHLVSFNSTCCASQNSPKNIISLSLVSFPDFRSIIMLGTITSSPNTRTSLFSSSSSPLTHSPHFAWIKVFNICKITCTV